MIFSLLVIDTNSVQYKLIICFYFRLSVPDPDHKRHPAAAGGGQAPPTQGEVVEEDEGRGAVRGDLRVGREAVRGELSKGQGTVRGEFKI